MPVPAINSNFYSLGNIDENLRRFASIQPGDKVSLPRGATRRGTAGLVRIDKPTSLKGFRIQGFSRKDYDSITHAGARNADHIKDFFELAILHARDSALVIKAYRGVCNLVDTYDGNQNAKNVAIGLKKALGAIVKTKPDAFKANRIVAISQGDLFEDPRLGEGVCHGFVQYWFKRIFAGKQNLLQSGKSSLQATGASADAIIKQRMNKKFPTILKMQDRQQRDHFPSSFMSIHNDCMDRHVLGYNPNVKKNEITRLDNDLYKQQMVQFAKDFFRKGFEEMFSFAQRAFSKIAITVNALENPDLPRLFFLYFTVGTKHNGGGHAMGLCVSRDNASNYSYQFFDPNMGEYLFRNQNDFINFMGAWTRCFNRWFHSIKCNQSNPPREPLVRWDLSVLVIPRNYNFEDNPFKYMNFFRK
jgi:hypothetical protein